MYEGSTKSKKTGIIIAVVAVVLVVVLGVGAFFFLKSNDKNEKPEKEKSSSSQTEDKAVAVEKSNKTVENIEYADGLITIGDVDYVSDLQGIHKITANDKTTFTSQNTTLKISIINDKIYYGVVDKKDKFYSEFAEDECLWKCSSCWRMNLDGTQQEKLFSYSGCGFVVYADDDCIIYADEGEQTIYSHGYGYYLFKYDLKTKTSVLIDSGKVTYDTEDENGNLKKEVSEASVDNFTYLNGSIYYNIYEFDQASVSHAYRYDIADNRVYALGFQSSANAKVDDNTILFLAKNELSSAPVGHSGYYYCLNKLSTDKNEYETIYEFGYGSQEVDTGLNAMVKNGNGYYLYNKYAPEEGAYFVNTSTWTVAKTPFMDATQPLYSIEMTDNDYTEIAEYQNGSRNVLVTVDKDIWALTVGKNVGVYYYDDLESTLCAVNPNEFDICTIFNLNK